ncbi:MAG TPA: hypothetical protein VGK88_10150 [bacterium]|jgi:hypothetical protein
MRIRNPYDVPGTYRKAQLHCHTTESDGRLAPRALLGMYREAGYSFVCITDHHRVTRCDALDGADFLAVPGVEDEVSFGLPVLGPHMGRLFVEAPLRSGTAQERIDRTRMAGGLVSLCHPSWPGNLWTGVWKEAEVRALHGYHLMEIRNPHSRTEEDVRRWTSALRAHGSVAPIWGVAVDDCHSAKQFNQGWIIVKVTAITSAAFRSALLGGAFYATTGPAADFGIDDGAIVVRSGRPGRLRFLDGSDGVRLETIGERARYAVSGSEAFVRVELATADGTLWSQPFWIDP